eukprot:CAMPEP_0205823650 /NCGR_PEP_ID=MMETSP0206-20130828/17671_1 /ASSEMBLY_ACC=CAM_ASM_000279 /TAXON_ID=36767 /ORGANISM="Euplotes focardii, Strain TN1" /LENGTH=59 /DNA_ID=CAMNT_0053121037 /DNA_START=1001 /DNA_END=1180 /DNA_ORIENTATION=+
MKRAHTEEDEEGENIEEYFKDKSADKGHGTNGVLPQLITKGNMKKADNNSDKSDDEDDD